VSTKNKNNYIIVKRNGLRKWFFFLLGVLISLTTLWIVSLIYHISDDIHENFLRNSMIDVLESNAVVALAITLAVAGLVEAFSKEGRLFFALGVVLSLLSAFCLIGYIFAAFISNGGRDVNFLWINIAFLVSAAVLGSLSFIPGYEPIEHVRPHEDGSISLILQSKVDTKFIPVRTWNKDSMVSKIIEIIE